MAHKINPGIPLVIAGVSDIIGAGLIWLFIGDGSSIWMIVCGAFALIGLGVLAFGVLNTIRNM